MSIQSNYARDTDVQVRRSIALPKQAKKTSQISRLAEEGNPKVPVSDVYRNSSAAKQK